MSDKTAALYGMTYTKSMREIVKDADDCCPECKSTEIGLRGNFTLKLPGKDYCSEHYCSCGHTWRYDGTHFNPKPLSETNKYLRDPKKREEAIRRSVESSTAIEIEDDKDD